MGGQYSKIAEQKEKLTRSQRVEMINPPWRKFDQDEIWDPSYQNKLEHEIKERKETMADTSAVQYPRILLLGKSNAGKSSFINSADTIDKEEISCPVVVETHELTSGTKKVRNVYLRRKLGLCFVETVGIEDVKDTYMEDIRYIIGGHIKPGYEIDTTTPIQASNTFFKRSPSFADKIHCVAIVVDACVIVSKGLTEHALKKISKINDYAIDRDIPVVLLLTKVDDFHPGIKKDITNVHGSKDVWSVVEESTKLFGVKANNIFPIKNYTSESDVETNMNILLLLALRRILTLADDYITHQASP